MRLTLKEMLRIVEDALEHQLGKIVTAEMGCEYDGEEYDFYEMINDADVFVEVFSPGEKI